ncbi:hypothetical protein YC2023_089765 [Brassica napus]
MILSFIPKFPTLNFKPTRGIYGGSLRGEFVDATPFRDAVKKTRCSKENKRRRG